MKELPAGLSASLASGVTTLCACWRLERADGTVLGFTDHDRDIAFAGDDYVAESGLSASAWAATLGLPVDTIDAHGALSAEALTEDDLARKLWDGAKVTVFRVDWSEPANRAILFSGSIGEVERGPLAFRAELRSLSHALNQPTGRIFGRTCDADLGDGRCGIDLDDPAFSATATVAASISTSVLRTAGLDAHAPGFFRAGRLTWTSGANDGASVEIKRHLAAGSQRQIELAEAMPFAIEAGDGFSVTAGCDKTAETCKAKFDNLDRFRGFPFMPGNDWIMSYPNREDGNDGGSLG